MRVVITGGAGFIGSYLADLCLARDWRTFVLDDLSYGRRGNVPAGAELIVGDVSQASVVRNALKASRPDLVFHLAGSTATHENSLGWLSYATDYRCNQLSTWTLLDELNRAHARCRFINASTAAVYGTVTEPPTREDHPTDPISPYGIHKLAGEKYVQAFASERGIDGISVRIFNAYGPRQPRYVMFDLFEKCIAAGDEVEVLGTGKQIRSFCYIQDLVEGLVLIAERGERGEVYNLGSPIGTCIADLAEMIRDQVAPRKRLKFSGKSWLGDMPIINPDIGRVRALGFRERHTLEEGLRLTLDSFKDLKRS